MGHTPSTAGTFRKKFRKNSGKTPETLSERFLEFPSRVRLGCPKLYNSRHLRLPEHFQNYLPPNTAGGASFFRSGSREGLPELVMEFPAVLGAFLILFPATEPPDPGRVSEGVSGGVSEGFLKGFRRGQPRTSSKTLLKPFKNPSVTPPETPSETLLKPFRGRGVL